MSDEKEIPIVEYFCSFQGEGRFMGQYALFIRLAKCNLVNVCKYCDTDVEPKNVVSFDKIVHLVHNFVGDGGRLIVFTGGEPTLYMEKLLHIIQLIHKYNVVIQFETNGTIPIGHTQELSLIDLFVVSPKRGHTKNAYKYYTKLNNVDWKFVTGDVPNDSLFWPISNVKNEVEILTTKYHVPKDRIWLMPFGADEMTINKNMDIVWSTASTLSVNYSDRLHIRRYMYSKPGV